MAKFPGVDYMLLDSLLGEQDLLVRQTARQFGDERVAPLSAIASATPAFHANWFRRWRRWGSSKRILKATAEPA